VCKDVLVARQSKDDFRVDCHHSLTSACTISSSKAEYLLQNIGFFDFLVAQMDAGQRTFSPLIYYRFFSKI
jgi:hypothetical protein